MLLNIDEKDLRKFIMLSDRVLLKPKTSGEQTKGGLYLPPGVEEKRKIQSGYIIKTGPGYPIPSSEEVDQPWKEGEPVKYVPLQVREGDLAIYLQDSSFAIEFNKEKYIMVPHSAILMVIRDEELSE